jgi:hypothetical protein
VSRLAGPLVGVMALCACVTAPAAQHPASARSTPAATPSNPLIEVQRDGRVVLVDLKGTVVASTPQAPAAANGFVGIVAVGTGGDRAAYLDTRTGVLWALHRDGRIERLATTTISYTYVLLSPDGQQWAWGEQLPPGADGLVHSRLHIGGPGVDRVVQEMSAAQQALRPYRWNRSGLVVEKETIGLGAYVPFDTANGPVELVDSHTGAIHPLNLPTTCYFAARAVDGTIACLSQSGSGITLTLVKPDGGTSSVLLPKPQFNSAGYVSFRPGSSATTLVIGGTTYEPSSRAANAQFATGLLDVRGDRAVRGFGPAGIAPAGGDDWVWLDSGQIIGWGSLQGTASDSGVWLYAGDDKAQRVSSGIAYGVLN